ncbi:hypothetical protein [Okeania sp. SIO2G5]|nr:hypothetical protein [Okeania sp. SIO2G5]
MDNSPCVGLVMRSPLHDGVISFQTNLPNNLSLKMLHKSQNSS